MLRLSAALTHRSPSMNDLIPKRAHLIVLLATVASVSLLYQIVKGWNTVDFLLRVVLATALCLVIRRNASLFAQAHGGANPSRVQVGCWILAGAALFAGLMMGV
jgi:hypothetical protein